MSHGAGYGCLDSDILITPFQFGKLRYLNDVKISLPDHADGSTSASSEKLADFEHKKKNYEVYSLTNNTDDVSNIGAGEMHNMTALLASKRRKYTSGTNERLHVEMNAVESEIMHGLQFQYKGTSS